MARVSPRNLRFRLEVDGVPLARFSELVIGDQAAHPAGHMGDADPLRTKRRAGLAQARSVTLKGGTTDSTQLSAWRSKAVAGPPGSRQKVVIVEVDKKGTDVGRYVVAGAFPVKYEGAELNAEGNEVAIDSLELSSEGIELVS